MEAAADWARLKHGDGERCYSRRTICSMHWALDAKSSPLHHFTNAMMPCGGPIAMLNGDGGLRGSRMQVFTGAGVLLSAWDWDYGRVRKLGWTPASELVSVLETGRVMVWR